MKHPMRQNKQQLSLVSGRSLLECMWRAVEASTRSGKEVVSVAPGRRRWRGLLAGVLVAGWAASGCAQPVVRAALATAPFHQYEDAPATPDADDIAIWVHPHDPGRSLVIGTLKDAGLIV